MMKANVLEIFKSVQGEGKYVGVNQVFVRFFECNMHCVWCDTPHSIGDTTHRFDQYTKEDLLTRIDELWKGCHSLSLTGGEPLMQSAFIKTLLPELQSRKIKTYLETNGVFPDALADVIDGIDIIAMDLKLPSSTQCKEYWSEHQQFLKIARSKEVFLKTVISSETTQDDVIKAMDLVAGIDPDLLFIVQPNFFQMNNGVMQKSLQFEELLSTKLTNVRIIPQVHKFMKLR